MGFLTAVRSSTFATGLLCLLTHMFFHLSDGHPVLKIVPMVLALYHFYLSFSSKKIEGAEQWKVIIIGAGMSGLNAAKRLKEAGVPFIILEKANQLGGTWWFNTYPGAACDVASHLYSLSSYLNPWWSRAYSKQGEIEEYLSDFAKKFDLIPSIKFNERVKTCEWSEKNQEWTVLTESGKKFEANFVLSGSGALHVPSKPTFKNQDQFTGRIFHTAEWPEDIDIKGKKVALIGTGASAVQVVPAIAKEVQELHVFQRTPAWVPPRLDYKFPWWLQRIFAIFPPAMLVLRWFIFWRAEFRFLMVFHNGRKWLTDRIKSAFEKEMRKVVTDPDVADKLIPKYPIGCKRITPSDDYLKAFNLSHVKLVTDPIDGFSSKGVISNGKEFEADIIILATGFDVMASSLAFTAKGKGGKILHEEWKDEPTLYLGCTYPRFPNLFFMLGPGTGLGHNSVVYMIECQTDYAMDAITKIIKNGHKSIDCKQEKLTQYEEMVNTMMKDRVFAGGSCRAWYLNARGVNWTLWPGNLTHYWWITRTCNMDDYLVK